MTDEIKALLTKLATLKILDEKEWNSVYGPDGNRSASPAYSHFVKSNAAAQQTVMAALKAAGYPVMEYCIRGEAPNGVEHYAIDDAIKNEFGDHVIVDSEQGQLFIYASEKVCETVLSRVQEMVGEGTVTLYSGDSYPAWVEMEQDSDLQVAAIGSWTSAHAWLKANS